MSEQPAGEKVFDPTPKRKQDATKKGDVLRSKEVATAVSVAVGGAWLLAGGPWLINQVNDFARASFRFDRQTLDNFQPGKMMSAALEELLPPILVLGVIVMGVTVTAQLLLGDGRFVPANLKPKASRISPLKGAKRIFGMQGLIELFKSLLKLILLGGLAYLWARYNIETVIGLGRGDLAMQLATAWDSVVILLAMLAFGLFIVAMIDWPIQFIQRLNRLKMTHQEMRDENKQAEGSPEMRSARKQRQRDMSRGGVTKAVKEAQFLLTNPTHFSIAMTYDTDLAAAPVVYFTTRKDQMIREELYVAIAALVSFVFALKRGEHPVRPTVEVPVELRFDAEGRIISA